jgi:hypothetical protein
MITPTSSAFCGVILNRAESTACKQDATANWVKRIHVAYLFAVDVNSGIEVFYLGGEFSRKIRGIER